MGLLKQSVIGLAVGLLSCLIPLSVSVTPLRAAISFSILACLATAALIPLCSSAFLSKNLSGRDLNKKGRPVIPESMGAIAAVVYLFVMLFFIPILFYEHLGTETFPHNKLGTYLSAVMALQSTVILGLADDFFDLRWRHKFFIPAFASIPLLVVYYVDYGITYVVVPSPLQPYIGDLIDLGWLYYFYMSALSIFCTNSINILAGVNGVEVGQSVVITISILANDLLYITGAQPHVGPHHPAMESHLFSAYFALPFLGVSIGLLWHNWWPARVFVGDTYCYFAGMIFATIGILGHFSKTLLLFFIPQVFNFILSAPQLFHVIPCPRHRLPRLQENGLLEASIVEFPRPPTKMQRVILTTAELFGLVRLDRLENGQIISSTNFTLISFVLVRFGQMREDRLTMIIMLIQAIFCTIGFFVRHRLARLLFVNDNRLQSIFYA